MALLLSRALLELRYIFSPFLFCFFSFPGFLVILSGFLGSHLHVDGDGLYLGGF
jgi:hypothetical protein